MVRYLMMNYGDLWWTKNRVVRIELQVGNFCTGTFYVVLYRTISLPNYLTI